MKTSPILKWVLKAVGVIAVALGTLGIFVPLLPTTPFLLLAAACFIRSSPRLYRWLITHRWFGSYIKNYREHRALPLRAKIVTLLSLWLTIGYTSLAVVEALWLRLLLFAIATGVTVHLSTLHNRPPEKASASEVTETQEAC